MQIHNLFVAITLLAAVCLCGCDDECENGDESYCHEGCPEDMVLYIPGCENETMSQRTCRHPIATSKGFLCDYISCECEEPQVFDEGAKKCVLLEECSDQPEFEDEK